LAGLGIASAVSAGSYLWRHRTDSLADKLCRASLADGRRNVDFSRLDGLPAPVAKYFRLTLKDGQPIIRWARIRQTGLFCTGLGDHVWNPFEATQTFSAQPAGFVWDADMRMNALARIRVRDAYAAGKAEMKAKVLSLLPVVDAHGRRELAEGALQRYLAEAVWLPTALLPEAGVRWSGLDDDKAVATLTDSGLTVSLEFRFNPDGEITSVYSPGRYRELSGHYTLTPWEAYVHDYREVAGMRVPFGAEAAWLLQGKSLTYFQASVSEIVYDFTY
jgi:hypothetical protein